MTFTEDEHKLLNLLITKLEQDDEQYRRNYGSYRNGNAIEIIDEILMDGKIVINR